MRGWVEDMVGGAVPGITERGAVTPSAAELEVVASRLRLLSREVQELRAVVAPLGELSWRSTAATAYLERLRAVDQGLGCAVQELSVAAEAVAAYARAQQARAEAVVAVCGP